MHTLIHDIRYAVRCLVKTPAFTAPALLTLALGIGANTAMLSLVNALMLRPLPGLTESDRLVWVGRADRRIGHAVPLGPAALRDIETLGVFERLAWSAPVSLNLVSRGEPARVSARLANGDYFSTLGVTPVLGRFFIESDEETPGASPVAVLSWDYWQRHFGGDPAVLGHQLLLNGHAFTVVGVAERGFIGTELADHPPVLWGLLTGSSRLIDRRDVGFEVVGRLREGVLIQQASAALEPLAARLAEADATSRRDLTFQLIPIRGGVGAADRGDALSVALIGFAVVGAVLLIACANVAGLLLARASRREREIGVRIALGANRRRLVRQLLTEHALLALIAGAGGLLVAWWATTALVAALAVPLPLDLRPDGTVLAGTVAISLLAVLVFGMVPALNASRLDVVSTFAGASVAGPSRPRARLQRRFVVAQIALSLVLLATAGMLLRELHTATLADTGAGDTDRLLVASFDLTGDRYSPERQRAFVRQLLERLEQVPDIETASIAALAPLGGRMPATVQVEGRPDPPDGRPPIVSSNWVGPGYFQTVGTPIVRGRAFTDGDILAALPVAVINETMARRFWPGEEVLGQRFHTSVRAEVTVIGVVADSPYDSAGGRPTPFVFLPTAQQPMTWMATTLLVRARHDGRALLPIVRSAVARIDPALPLFDARTMEAVLAGRRAPQRAASFVLDLFGALALLLTSIGVYGVMAYAVERRTREIGVRVALGARPYDVLRLLMQEGATIASFGVAIGLAAAVAVTKVFSSVTGVENAGPTVLAGASGVVVACMLIACWLPATRAMQVDPTVALRVE